jgi:hypothetical protein
MSHRTVEDTLASCERLCEDRLHVHVSNLLSNHFTQGRAQEYERGRAEWWWLCCRREIMLVRATRLSLLLRTIEVSSRAEAVEVPPIGLRFGLFSKEQVEASTGPPTNAIATLQFIKEGAFQVAVSAPLCRGELS